MATKPESKYDRIERQIESFPALPATVAQVLDVTSNPDSSANDLMQAILPDQSMCIAILKIANSALFGRPKKVSSLETAITTLGFNEIESIVLGKAVVSSFNGLLDQHKEELDQFWDHSFTCALAAKIIAVNLSIPPGQFFIGGLIHDIGKLAMLLTFPAEYSPSYWLTQFSDKKRRIAEKQTFGVSHDLIAGRLLQKWLFPENLLLALGFHHAPQLAPKSQGYPLVIQLADVMAYLCSTPELTESQDFLQIIKTYLPEAEKHWLANKLPWNETSIESWFAWLKIDHAHGSSILKILSS